jgi:hypothetical protein
MALIRLMFDTPFLRDGIIFGAFVGVLKGIVAHAKPRNAR